jgi:hypothetical protein
MGHLVADIRYRLVSNYDDIIADKYQPSSSLRRQRHHPHLTDGFQPLLYFLSP